MQINNKLREALEALNRIDTRGLKRLLCELVESDIFDGGQINKTISAVDKAKAALAAPPRNCDKYATADEALKAQEQMFNDSNLANGECKLGCPECDNPRVGCKIAWLFAPATEQEGGGR